MLAQRLVSEARHETKSVILYDYLYTQFEEGISASILKPQGLMRDNFVSVLKDAFLVKVEGNAEIEDYERLAFASEHFSANASDLAWVSGSGLAKLTTGLMQTQVQVLQEQAKNCAGGERSRINSEIANIQREIKENQDPTKLRSKLLDQMGFDIDPEFMQSIARLFRHYIPNNFEVTILPAQGSQEVVFRGILDKKLLRVQPEYLRVLYEGLVSKKWTMVGEVTYFPCTSSTTESVVDTVTELVVDEQSTQNDSAMKDALRKVFKSLATMEGTFFESKERVEVRLRPLAIYQENEIQVST